MNLAEMMKWCNRNISSHGYIAPRHNQGVILIEKGHLGVSVIPDNNGIMIILYSYCAFLVSNLISKNNKAFIFTYLIISICYNTCLSYFYKANLLNNKISSFIITFLLYGCIYKTQLY